MKRSTIQISFEEEKLAALSLYLKQKNLTVEGELQDALADLYARLVPISVREFVAMNGNRQKDTD